MYQASIAKIIIIFVVALLIPILSFTIYQYMQSNENEDLLKSIYSRQLETLLFSINQKSYDIFKSLTIDLSATLQASDPESWHNVMLKDLTVQPGIIATVVRTGEAKVIYFGYRDDAGRFKAQCVMKMEELLRERHVEFERMVKRASEERYIQHLAQPLKAGLNKEISLLLFPVIIKNRAVLAGFVIDKLQFIEEVVGREFSSMNDPEIRSNEMADGKFVFAVKDRINNRTLYSTQETEVELFEKREKFWLLDDLEIMVKMSGTNINEIAHNRTRRNLIVLGLVNIVLILGVLYILRNISLEMGLAEMKTDFVANVSHEFRTPLALIRMYAETLEMGRVALNKRKYYYKTIISESARLTQLINNILDFSKIQTRMKRYHFSDTNLQSVLHQALDSYKYHLDRNNFDLKLDIDENLPLIKADREAVTQAIVNLLDNAIKYSKDSKLIEVDLKKGNGAIVLSITDHGIGIAESEQNKIFEKFYRVGSSLEHNTKGSGLGLSLVQHIMHVHRGSITVKSKPGKGSTFSLLFPVNKHEEV
jgi:two-component system phosphate regulon sensor histidine kinase PhoR